MKSLRLLTHLLGCLLFYSLAHSFTYLITHSIACSFTHSLSYSLIRSFALLLSRSLTHSIDCHFSHSLTYTLTRSLARSLAHLLTHSIACSFTHSLTYALTHSFTRIALNNCCLYAGFVTCYYYLLRLSLLPFTPVTSTHCALFMQLPCMQFVHIRFLITMCYCGSSRLRARRPNNPKSKNLKQNETQSARPESTHKGS